MYILCVRTVERNMVCSIVDVKRKKQATKAQRRQNADKKKRKKQMEGEGSEITVVINPACT